MSQEAGTKIGVGESGATPPRLSVRGLTGVLVNWLRSDLFLRTASGPVGRRKVLLSVAGVAVAAAISLSRTVGAGSLNTIWIEDAKFLLNGALNQSVWGTLTTPISSYYQMPARLFTQIAIQFPLSWAPGVMSLIAALQYAMYGLVAYIASGPHLRSPWLRLLIAAPVCAIPLAYTQVNNDLVTVQFFGLYGAFWTLLWIPGTRAGRILSPVVMMTVSWTAVLSVVFAPLVVARLIADRSRNAWCVAILWATGVLLQFSQTLLGKTHNHLSNYNGPFFVLRNYLTRVMPRALFGERSLGGAGADYRGYYASLHILNAAAHHALIIGAWVIVLVIVGLAVAKFTDPNWTLAAVAAVFSLAIFGDEVLINTPVVQPRYVIAPAMLLYTALVALMRPRRQEETSLVTAALRWLPVAGFAALLLVAITLNFRVTNGRTTSPAWTSVVATASKACAMPGVTAYSFVHEWWYVTIPCSKVG
jgi:hypothetical protein